jgi:hypothetical protein
LLCIGIIGRPSKVAGVLSACMDEADQICLGDGVCSITHRHTPVRARYISIHYNLLRRVVPEFICLEGHDRE